MEQSHLSGRIISLYINEVQIHFCVIDNFSFCHKTMLELVAVGILAQEAVGSPGARSSGVASGGHS